MSSKYNPRFMKKFVNEEIRPNQVPPQRVQNPLPAIPEEPEAEEGKVAVQPSRK